MRTWRVSHFLGLQKSHWTHLWIDVFLYVIAIVHLYNTEVSLYDALMIRSDPINRRLRFVASNG